MKMHIAAVDNFVYINLEVWEHFYVVTWMEKDTAEFFCLAVKFV